MYRGYGSKQSFWIGVGMLVVGLVITVGSFLIASLNGGGTYYFSFGLIILGIIRIATALPGMLRGGSQPQRTPMTRMPPPGTGGYPGTSGYPMPYGAPQVAVCWNCSRPTNGQSVCPNCGAPQYQGQQQPPMGAPGTGAAGWGQQPYPPAGAQGYPPPGQYPAGQYPPGQYPPADAPMWGQQQQPPRQGGR